MITVCLYGGLREYGRRFVLHVETPAEALHALFTQIKGLRRRIRDGVYQVRFDGKDHSEETISSVFRRPADGVLHIVPRVQGAGKNGGLIQTVIGAVLIVVGAFTSWAGGTQLIAVGIGMVAGGVAQMLTKQPKLNAGGKGVEESKNSAFSNLAKYSGTGSPCAVGLRSLLLRQPCCIAGCAVPPYRTVIDGGFVRCGVEFGFVQDIRSRRSSNRAERAEIPYRLFRRQRAGAQL